MLIEKKKKNANKGIEAALPTKARKCFGIDNYPKTQSTAD